MNLETKIAAARECMQRDFHGSLEPATLEAALAEIRTAHYRELRAGFVQGLQSVLGRLHLIAARPVTAGQAGAQAARAASPSQLVLH